MKRIFNRFDLLFIWLIIVITMGSCSKNIFVSEPSGEVTARMVSGLITDTTLRNILPFPIGAAVKLDKIDNDTAYRNSLMREFNSLTAEGAMKMTTLQPTQGVFNFNDADSIIDFAIAHGIRVHGHTLVWGSVPAWVASFSGDSTAWENIMKTHIETVVTHFKGRVASWDVVNEAIADNGTIKANIWYNHLGPGYIARAFQYAHAADTAAKLFYNDYGQEYSTVRRHAINDLIRSIQAAGIRIDGIGLQMHTSKNLNTSYIEGTIDSAAATGLLVHISELDVALNTTKSATYTATAADYAIQDTIFKMIANSYVHSVSPSKQFGITTWSVDDKNNWRRFVTSPPIPDWPVLLDEFFQPKQCYYSFIEGALN